MVDFSQILLRQCTLSYRRLAPKFQHSLPVDTLGIYLCGMHRLFLGQQKFFC
jgi:hypothetical protein